MHCSDFLHYYSEYRDGRVADLALRERLHHHVRTCPRCMRYDALVSQGVMVLRATSDLEPSRGFRRRLRHRLFAGQAATEAEPLAPAPATAIVAILFVAALALMLGGNAATAPSWAAATATPLPRPIPVVIATPGLPLVTFLDLSSAVPQIHGARTSGAAESLGTWATLPR